MYVCVCVLRVKGIRFEKSIVIWVCCLELAHLEVLGKCLYARVSER